ncbi:MAG: hypothetical protein AAB562_03395 [Patescibacteria group bacterium]
MDNLRRAVISTLAFAEGVSYPLSALEVWRGLVSAPSAPRGVHVSAVAKALSDLASLGIVREERGLFFLPTSMVDPVRSQALPNGISGREPEGASVRPTLSSGATSSTPASNGVDCNERARRYRIAERKFRRARRVARLLRHMPFVRAIAVCNSLAVSNAREDSDVDLFLIAAPRRLWTARLLAVGLLRLLRLRPGETVRDPVCLHFFVSADALSLRDVALPRSPAGSPDLYLAWWVTELVPLVDGGVMEHFWKANAWAREQFPNAAPKVPSPRRSVLSPSAVSRFLERLVPQRAEVFAEWLQRKLLPPELSARANRGTEIVLSASRIKCHADDRRAQYRSLWEERVSSLLSSVSAT